MLGKLRHRVLKDNMLKVIAGECQGGFKCLDLRPDSTVNIFSTL